MICVGCGLDINPDTGLLEVDVKPGGGISCDDTGIFVTVGSSSIATTDTATVHLAGNGSSGSHLTADVKKSSAVCNGIRLDGDGIWSQEICTKAGTQPRGYAGASFPVLLDTPGPTGYTVYADGGGWTITNDTNCNIHGVWDAQVYGGGVDAEPGFDGYAYAVLSTDGGLFNASTPPTFFRMDNRASSPAHPNAGFVVYDINNLWERNYIHLNPGESHNFVIGVKIQVLAGVGHWHDATSNLYVALDNPSFEYHWQITTQGIC